MPILWGNGEMISIIGYGHVGKKIHDDFKLAYPIIYDKYLPNINTEKRLNDAKKCKYAFVCVPTPSKSDGKCDISIVEEVVSWLESDLIIIKSTIPPGTTEYLIKKYKKRIIHSPEYFGETKTKPKSDIDEGIKRFLIFGGHRNWTIKAVKLHQKFFGPTVKFIQTDAKTAELVKYMENAFYASKVTFCNEMYEIAENLGIDYEELRELWLLDERINRNHTIVTEKRGYSGKCLPKDTQALVRFSGDLGYDAKFLKEVIRSNRRFKHGSR